ncbi:MAG TPA: DUF1893 domain-containing protein [Sedimentibacter sp.]|jgi:hypothetical protein|nr:DUF1893 domain-containing protein [Sedimentibacter sp.]HHZ01255.1 DUF1893 domain-containing protein [Tissierellia bacterium]HOW23934.1 DUF1893 domain-containing protein [Sedimentibacter sp.]HRC81992.1 DUF1893 domain-containing protein [Sedimentibacter sp.]
MKDIELAKKLLDDEEKALVIVKDGKILFSSEDKGIKPLYTAFKELKDQLQGSSAADKVIGRAAAMICQHAGIREVFAKLISEKALDVFENTSIAYEYEKVVPYIKNRDLSGMCPIESLSLEANNPEELLTKISKLFES